MISKIAFFFLFLGIGGCSGNLPLDASDVQDVQNCTNANLGVEILANLNNNTAAVICVPRKR